MNFDNINIRKIISTAISQNAIIVDVRTYKQFCASHIPMSVNLPLDKIKAGHITFPQSRTLIVYCDTGGASMQAARILADSGYNVINCIGGIRDYNGSLTK